jgi:hypothetical protein
MALQHKLSDAIAIKEDVDATSLLKHPVLEITMRYVRYRFVLDDDAVIEQITAILSKTSRRQKNVKGVVKMPSFYLKEK